MSSRLNDNSAPHRVLVIDDMPAIHEDYRKVLGCGAAVASAQRAAVDEMEALLFGGADDESADRSAANEPIFDVEFALQGEAGVGLAAGARERGRPFAMAFVD